MPGNKKLYFIVGSGRSGTTLLSKLLNAHPQIHSLPEANFLIFFLNAYKKKKVFTKDDIDIIFEQIAIYHRAHPWPGWIFSEEEARSELMHFIHSDKRQDYAKLVNIVYRHFKVEGADKTQAEIMLDKNPSFSIFIDHIGDYFTDAKFLFIVRDYRANVLSLKQSPFLRSTNVAYNAVRWKWFNKKLYRFMQANKERVHLLRYEDLVSDTENELAKVYDFLKISRKFETPHADNVYEKVTQVTGVEEKFKGYFEKKYSDLAKPVNTDRLEAWKTALTKDEIASCDAFCAPFAAYFGYKAFVTMNAVEKALVTTKNITQFIRAILLLRKERLVYYFSPAIKLKRLKVVYKKYGF